MADKFEFEKLKITDSEWNPIKISNVANRPNAKTAYGLGLSAEDTKKLFDKPSDLLRARFNALTEYAGAEEAARAYAETARVTAEKAREEAEDGRENREMERMDAEKTRYENEQIRVQNEQARGAVTNAMLEGLDNLLTLQQIYIDMGGAGV